jgi:hypothetical protein
LINIQAQPDIFTSIGIETDQSKRHEITSLHIDQTRKGLLARTPDN